MMLEVVRWCKAEVVINSILNIQAKASQLVGACLLQFVLSIDGSILHVRLCIKKYPCI
jgi:hypothetical protein